METKLMVQANEQVGVDRAGATEQADGPDLSVHVETLVHRALEQAKRGLSVEDAAESVWSANGLNATELAELAELGFHARVSTAWRALRSASAVDEQGRPKIAFGRTHRPRAEADVLARVYLQGADGKQRPLLKFGLEDWVEFTQLAASMEAGWARRQQIAREAVKFLKQAAVTRTEELPRDDLRRLNELAKEAWR